MHYLKVIDRLVGVSLTRLLPRPSQAETPSLPINRLLIIRPGGIGDAVLLIPVIRYLRQIFPTSRIEVLAEKRNCGVFRLCPGIDRVLVYDRPRELGRVLFERYDLVIDSEQWHYLSAIIARMIRSHVKIGFGTNGRAKLFSHVVDYRHDRYEQASFFELLKPLGLESFTEDSAPFLTVPPGDQQAADDILKVCQDKPFIALFPGASIPERCWGDENFHGLAEHLIEMGKPVVVVGGKEGAAAGSRIVAETDGLNVAGKTTLAETAGVLKRAQLLISGDSGVLHLAVGLGTPTVSLFGPGIVGKWAPAGRRHTVINHELPCSPCTKFGTTPPCPIGAKCVQGVSVEEVFVAAQKLLIRNLKEKGSDAV